MISCLRSFYKFYAHIGEIEKNTTELIGLPAIPDKNISTMDKDQVTCILDAVNNTANIKENELAIHNKIEKTWLYDNDVVFLEQVYEYLNLLV